MHEMKIVQHIKLNLCRGITLGGKYAKKNRN